jgi:hypothetical protein
MKKDKIPILYKNSDEKEILFKTFIKKEIKN